MASELVIPDRPSRAGEPAWEIFDRLPLQGEWSEAEFLALDPSRAEFTDGFIEGLPVPTLFHQRIALWFYTVLSALQIDGQVGEAVVAPFKFRARKGKWREPDVCYLKPTSLHRRRNAGWGYADLLIEVVSDKNRDHDYVQKRLDYAEGGVPEYWIVDPDEQCITVLQLVNGAYVDAGRYVDGQHAVSPTLPGLRVDVGDLFRRAVVTEG